LRQLAFRDERDSPVVHECDQVDDLLNKCQPHHYELDFNKYTKSILATFLQSYRWVYERKGKDLSDHHHLLLYNYLYLDDTLKWLSELGVKHLPGTEKKINSVRPSASCEHEEILMKKFHNCFSHQLVGLQ